MNAQPLPEPWLRGPIAGVHPVAAPLLYAFSQVREDLSHWTAALTTEQIWARPLGLGAIGFHIRHIGGATERLVMYLKGEQLTEVQIRDMKAEMEAGATREELLRRVDEQLLAAQTVIQALDPRTWNDVRTVGRKALPTTVGGLVTHLAEHAQRHCGEVIVTAKVVQSLGA